MLSVAEAQTLLRSHFAPLGAETVPLTESFGRVLAAPIVATRDQPPFAASAMDGYACPAEAAARDLRIVGESAAGHGFNRTLQPGEAIRISTGAPAPEGADGILPQEDAQRDGDTLRNALVARGRHVRPRGGDYAAGARLLEQGRVLDPVSVALAASAGLAELPVVRRPRIGVFASGAELVAPGQSAGDAQIFESGAYAVRGLIEHWGGAAHGGAILPDDGALIASRAREALRCSDLLVLIGGASVGPHDHARPALETLGLTILFDKVAVRPGKPTWFAVGAEAKVLGLPGNPASAIVCAHLFLRHAIDAMLGRSGGPALHHAPLGSALEANGARETYLRAALDSEGRLHAASDQDSSLLSVFSQSNALILRPPQAPEAPAGQPVPYLPIDGRW
jgi:molybdopterin molybdotransferase